MVHGSNKEQCVKVTWMLHVNVAVGSWTGSWHKPCNIHTYQCNIHTHHYNFHTGQIGFVPIVIDVLLVVEQVNQDNVECSSQHQTGWIQVPMWLPLEDSLSITPCIHDCCESSNCANLWSHFLECDTESHSESNYHQVWSASRWLQRRNEQEINQSLGFNHSQRQTRTIPLPYHHYQTITRHKETIPIP